MKNKTIRILLAALILALGVQLYPFPVRATDVGGIINTDTIWDSTGNPYIVQSKILVLEGVRLTISPGSIINFTYNTGMDIGGELRAIGSEDQPILFTSNQSIPTPGDWCGIKFVDSSIDAQYDSNNNFLSGNIIKYATIEYAGSSCDSYNGAAITCIDSSPFISNSIIRYNSGGSNGGGFYLRGCEDIRIYSNEIVDNSSNGQGGAFWILSVTGEIKYNIIRNNQSGKGGAFYIAYDSPCISNNTIEDNNAGGIGGGFYIRDLGRPIEIVYNNLINNTPYAISLDPNYSSSKVDIHAFNNYWGTASIDEIEDMVYHYYDNLSLAEVLYSPFSSQLIDIEYPTNNSPPTANAGPDQIIFDTITLDGSQSSDPDEDIVAYEWQIQHTVDPAYDRAVAGKIVTLTSLPFGFYNIILTVTDSEGAVDTDTAFFSATGPKGDFDFDGDVDGDDLAEFSINFGM